MISLLRPWWDSGSPERERNRAWTRRLWRVLLPDAEVIEGPAGTDRVCRSVALNWCAAQASGDILVGCDVDVWVDGPQLAWALNEARRPGLVLPYTHAQMLPSDATDTVLQTGEPPYDDPDSRLPGSVGGLFVCSRATFDTVGGLDERFQGWGFQDVAFERAIAAAVAPTRRCPGPFYHLHHPFDTWCDTNHPSYHADKQLAERYYVASSNPVAMRRLLER